MTPRPLHLLLLAGWAALGAGSQPWKDTAIADWTEEEAYRVITDSPWAKAVTPELVRAVNTSIRPLGRRGLVNPQDGALDGSTQAPLRLTVRWESAAPVRGARNKLPDTFSPGGEKDHYLIGVYGVPDQMVRGDSNRLGAELKKRALLRREGKKDARPTNVDVLQFDAGTVIVFYFPRTAGIGTADPAVLFQSDIGPLKVDTVFVPGEMVYAGKLEL